MLMMMNIMILSMILPMIMIIIYFMISKKKHLDREKSSPFECGFDPMSPPRLSFSLRFYLISIIFLIFDIEIVILFPMVPSFWLSNPIIWLTVVMTFLLLMVWGLFIEWNEGTLFWMD
uniref:NADH-ubiquinone oxidoreductase chain 3 n=1 Tax=Syrista parreyssii TaxID=1090889 RepID=A0A1W6Q5G9_9HYME|nr:NADH dehydrogenase subunit 3 [Syrista parreyssii]UGN61582.1 NADH dehydrogenase subunit 3 [Syrista parreyssii]